MLIVFELATGKQVHLTAKECRFGYRDSIFKHQYRIASPF